MKKEINFFIHDLHPFGGQDRSTLEIINKLSRHLIVHVFAYTFHNPAGPNPNIHFHRSPIQIKRPVLFKILWFHLWSLWIKATTPRRLTFATGTCSLASDIVHVQFVAKEWRQEKQKMLIQNRGLLRFYHFILSSYNEWMEKVLFSNQRSYAAISGAVAESLKKHFGVHKISVIHHGVDVGKFAPASSVEEKNFYRKKLNLPQGVPIFLFVGAYDRKGLATLILAAKKVRAVHDAIIVAVGSGNKEKYFDLAADKNAQQWLLLRSASAEIEDYYRAADCFVLPTLYEPFGLVILEAMSVALPVIVSEVAGASELVKNGKNGFLLKNPTDHSSLAEAMLQLLSSPENAKLMGNAARATAEGRSWEEVAGDFVSLIETEMPKVARSYQ